MKLNLREIDRLVAEKVMGWKIDEQVSNDDVVAVFDEKGNWGTFKPTEWIQDAWQVVEKMREGRIFSLCDAWDENDEPIFYANFQYNDGYHVVNYDAYAKTATLAICLAALKAVGVEVEVTE